MATELKLPEAIERYGDDGWNIYKEDEENLIFRNASLTELMDILKIADEDLEMFLSSDMVDEADFNWRTPFGSLEGMDVLCVKGDIILSQNKDYFLVLKKTAE